MSKHAIEDRPRIEYHGVEGTAALAELCTDLSWRAVRYAMERTVEGHAAHDVMTEALTEVYELAKREKAVDCDCKTRYPIPTVNKEQKVWRESDQRFCGKCWTWYPGSYGDDCPECRHLLAEQYMADLGLNARCDDREPTCIAQWPQCQNGEYDPRCCRFPKSCSC